MKNLRLPSRLALSLTLALAIPALLGAAPVFAGGILWVDTHHESISIPLESPALGLARAKYYIEQQKLDRAELALRKIVARYPTAAEAHQLLATLYRQRGETALASLHEQLAAKATG
jgi:tetratricopeptide (TPR) repeat protein